MRKQISTKMFSWGINSLSIGYEPKPSEDITLPKQIRLSRGLTPKKCISGLSQSLVLTNEGQI